MPTNFYSFAWPIAFSIILLAGLIVILAALATLIAAIAKARQLGKEKDSQESEVKIGKVHLHNIPIHSDDPFMAQSGVMETMTTDGIHYIPTL